MVCGNKPACPRQDPLPGPRAASPLVAILRRTLPPPRIRYSAQQHASCRVHSCNNLCSDRPHPLQNTGSNKPLPPNGIHGCQPRAACGFSRAPTSCHNTQSFLASRLDTPSPLRPLPSQEFARGVSPSLPLPQDSCNPLCRPLPPVRRCFRFSLASSVPHSLADRSEERRV